MDRHTFNWFQPPVPQSIADAQACEMDDTTVPYALLEPIAQEPPRIDIEGGGDSLLAVISGAAGLICAIAIVVGTVFSS